MKFKELLQLSIKSEDTEEWLDKVFTRPIGLFFALIWKRLGVHPNAVTILSIFLGIGAACMFYYTDITHNICGVILLMFANFCDSTDGQLARLTNKKSFVGRVLDGFAGDVWFFCIYYALCLRLMPQDIPFTSAKWGFWIWLLAYLAGVVCHTNQSSLADYYRQIHLFFLKGKEGSELDNSRQQYEILENLTSSPREAKESWASRLLARTFYYNYARYCRGQERRTPMFQKFFSTLQKPCTKNQSPNPITLQLRQDFLQGSRPLMKYTNILTFNCRAIVLYVSCLAGIPYLFFLFDITVLYKYMHHKHETLCATLLNNSQKP